MKVQNKYMKTQDTPEDSESEPGRGGATQLVWPNRPENN